MALSECRQIGARYAYLPERVRTRSKRRRGILPTHTRGAMMTWYAATNGMPLLIAKGWVRRTFTGLKI
jgi:hypothetical protein